MKAKIYIYVCIKYIIVLGQAIRQYRTKHSPGVYVTPEEVEAMSPRQGIVKICLVVEMTSLRCLVNIGWDILYVLLLYY